MKLKKMLKKNKRLAVIIACSLLLPSLIALWVIYMFYNCTNNFGCLIIFLPFAPGLSFGDAIGIDLVGWPLIFVNWIFYMVIGAVIGLLLSFFFDRNKKRYHKL